MFKQWINTSCCSNLDVHPCPVATPLDLKLDSAKGEPLIIDWHSDHSGGLHEKSNYAYQFYPLDPIRNYDYQLFPLFIPTFIPISIPISINNMKQPRSQYQPQRTTPPPFLALRSWDLHRQRRTWKARPSSRPPGKNPQLDMINAIYWNIPYYLWDYIWVKDIIIYIYNKLLTKWDAHPSTLRNCNLKWLP